MDENKKGYKDTNFNEIKAVLEEMMDSNYEEYVKAILSIELSIDDNDVLKEMYDQFMEGDAISLVNNFFEEINYNIEHEQKFNKMLSDTDNKALQFAKRLDDYIYDLDPYGYIDGLVGSREDVVMKMANDIGGGKIDEVMEGLDSMIEEYEGEDDEVVERLKDFKKEVKGIVISKNMRANKKINKERKAILKQLRNSKEKTEKPTKVKSKMKNEKQL